MIEGLIKPSKKYTLTFQNMSYHCSRKQFQTLHKTNLLRLRKRFYQSPAGGQNKSGKTIAIV